MRPLLLRPPVEGFPSVSCFSGLPLWRPERTTLTSWRRLGVTGLNVFSAIGASLAKVSKPGRHIDLVTLGEGHDGLLQIGLDAARAFVHFSLALADERIDRFHLDIEKPLYRRLYLVFRRIFANLEDDLIYFRRQRRLFGDNRGDDHVVMMRIVREFGRAHLKRASKASIAALVKTSFSRRRMS